MPDPNAAHAGTFKLGGDLQINRMGFGAMRVTGPGIWGAPADHGEAIRTLKRVPEVGINFIDTADSYGPETSEALLHEALHPYPAGLVIATKGGQTRNGPGRWIPVGRPEYLIQQALLSQRRLGVDIIDLWQLHRIDPKVPRDEQFSAIKSLIDDGVVRYAGLSEVTVEEIEAASKYFKVVSVQNRYNVVDRKSEDVLDYCEKNAIGFIPWAPLGSGQLAGAKSRIEQIAQRLKVTPGQLAIAWLLKRSPVILPIPGTSKVAHLEENAAAADIALSDADFAALDEAGKAAA